MPPKQIFDVVADHPGYPDQWFLNEPLAGDWTELDAQDFTEGTPYQGPAPVVLPVGNPGRELAFNFAAFDMPVVSSQVADAIRRIAPNDVQWFPVTVPGAKGSYQILNAIVSLDCLDEERSEFTRWQPGDHRPDRVGHYHSIPTIRIDPVRTGDHHVFRILNWPIALLVSDSIRDALMDVPDLGVLFKPAS